MKMAPKKRDKDDGTKNTFNNRDLNVEHELFLQAFEKPTQIYRYLRARNMLSPIFLHRTLTYMKHRMSRTHKRRSEFKIDDMLAIKTKKIRQDRNLGLGNYMTLKFLGFYDKSLFNEYTLLDTIVNVEVMLLKLSHKKRKDSPSPFMQESFGTIEVIINPDDNSNEQISAISIPTDSFLSVNDTLQNQSHILVLKVEHEPKLNSMIASSDSIESIIKRQKMNTKHYGSELLMFDKHNRCLLSEGVYELVLSELLAVKSISPKKHSTWEIIPNDFNYDVSNIDGLFRKLPYIKFYLSWTNESCNGFVDKPKPIKKDPSNSTAISTNTSQQSSSILTITTNGSTSTVTPTSINGETLVNGKLNEIEKGNNFINNNSNNNNNSTVASSSALAKAIRNNLTENSQIIYQFIYNNNSRQQTQPYDDMYCPWCTLDCVTLYSLLKHLKLCHARFTFTYIPLTSGARIDVAINDLFDGSYVGSPHDLVGPGGRAFARGGPARRTSVTNLLVCRPRRSKPSLSEFLELDENELNNQRPYITGHNRLYHHTETCLPVYPKELDIDSEGESDPLWLQHKTMQMIDEFTDVNEGEKELMKMWNLHVMKHGYVGDCQLPIACDMFLNMHGHELLQKNLYRNFVLHMCSLFDYGLVSPEVVYKTIQKLQNILSTYHEGRKIIAESRENQLNYWLKVGIHKQAQQEELKLKQQQEQQQLRQNQKDQDKLNNTKKTSTELNSNMATKPKTEEENYNKKSEKHKPSSSSKTINNGTAEIQKSIISSTSSIISKKRSLNSIQNESISGKRRYSQLRDSPPIRRSLASSELQTQLKMFPPRRKSIAIFNNHSDLKNNSEKYSSTNGISKSSNGNNLLSSLLPSSSIVNQVSSSSSLSSVRKRVSLLAKVDKH